MGEAYFRAHFARKIKSLRENAGLSQGELGDILGCSRGSISFYEQMQRIPDIEILKNICQYFGVSADYLLGLSDVKSVDPELQAVCKYTGLSEAAVTALRDGEIDLQTVNFMVENAIIGGIREIAAYFEYHFVDNNFIVDSYGNIEPFNPTNVGAQLEKMRRENAVDNNYRASVINVGEAMRKQLEEDIITALCRLRGEYQGKKDAAFEAGWTEAHNG